jgi:hypothetical protein
MRIRIAVSSVALLWLVAGCASQMPTATAPAASATAAAPPTAALEEPFRSVLTRWNYYREAAGLAPIPDDPELNLAAQHHAKYLVENQIKAADAVVDNGRMVENAYNASAHLESEGNPYYTVDGDKWGRSSTIIRSDKMLSSGAPLVDDQASRVDSLAVVDPQLVAVGFGDFCQPGECVGMIVYRRGLPKSKFLALYEGNAMDWNPMLGDLPFTVARLRKPIEFPPAGMQFPSVVHRVGEYPDPLSSCQGFSMPVGVPIVLQLGAPTQGEDVKVSSSSLNDDGATIDTCAYDATSYANRDGYAQMAARRVLHAYGAVVVIPKTPLQAGHHYTVNIAADSTPYTWSFSIAPDAK